MSGTFPSPSEEPTESEESAVADAGEPRVDGGTATEADAAARSPPPVSPEASEQAATEAADADASVADTAADSSVRVCWLDDDGAADVIGALGPETARRILSAIHEEPQTASELAETVDTSVQNVRHHLSKLVDADLVAETDTRYSVKGREMTVYGPADDRVVVAVGGESERSSLLDSLRGLLGAVAVLAGASLFVQSLFGTGVTTLSGPETAPRVGDAVATDGAALLGTLSPGAAFFAGGLLVLATVLAVDRVRRR